MKAFEREKGESKKKEVDETWGVKRNPRNGDSARTATATTARQKIEDRPRS